jgi:UTP:GlnB (protein PII) uridylyltransferase
MREARWKAQSIFLVYFFSKEQIPRAFIALCRESVLTHLIPDYRRRLPR